MILSALLQGGFFCGESEQGCALHGIYFVTSSKTFFFVPPKWTPLVITLALLPGEGFFIGKWCAYDLYTLLVIIHGARGTMSCAKLWSFCTWFCIFVERINLPLTHKFLFPFPPQNNTKMLFRFFSLSALDSGRRPTAVRPPACSGWAACS